MQRAIPIAAMVAVTAVWGWTFVIVRDAVSGYPVLGFLAIRFALATLCLAPLVLRDRVTRLQTDSLHRGRGRFGRDLLRRSAPVPRSVPGSVRSGPGLTPRDGTPLLTAAASEREARGPAQEVPTGAAQMTTVSPRAGSGSRRGGDVRAGVIPGVALAGGYLCQTVGLRYTTASRAGLLTGLFVVFTPLLAYFLARRVPPAITVLAVVGALAGTTMLVGGGSAQAANEVLGDGLEITTALCFSVHMILLARRSPGRNAGVMAWSQMAVATVSFSGGALVAGGFPRPSASVWLAIIITGVFASAVAFWVQTYVQQRISASRTAIILTAEPAFATFFGFLLAGDRFGTVQAAGAALILAAIVGHELSPLWLSPRRSAAI